MFGSFLPIWIYFEHKENVACEKPYSKFHPFRAPFLKCGLPAAIAWYSLERESSSDNLKHQKQKSDFVIEFSLKFLIGLIVRKCTLNRLFSVVEYFLGAVKESQISKKLVGIPAIEGSFDS